MAFVKKLLIFLLFIFSFINAYSINLNDTVSYWTFDNTNLSGSNPLDITLNGYDGTTNDMTTGVNGVIDQAFDYDGVNDYYNVGGQSMIDWLNDFDVNGKSWSYWVNASNVGIGLALSYTRDADNNPQLDAGTWDGSNYLRFVVGDDSGNLITATSGFVLNTSEWYHIVGTWNKSSNTLKMYVNGVEVDSQTGTSGTISQYGTDEPFTIGARRDGTTTAQFFNGQMDEWSLWNVTLDNGEVTQLYNSSNGYQFPFNNASAPVGPTPAITSNLSASYNVENISVRLTTSADVNMSYVIDGGAETSICNECDAINFNLTDLTEITHNVTWISTDENGQSNTSESFLIDLTNPILNVINLNTTSYEVDFSSLITCSDTNLVSCNVTTDEGNTFSYTNSSYLFATNGNHTFNVTAIDSVGNTNTSTNNLIFINPEFKVYFNNNSANVENFRVNSTNYTNYFNGSIYDYGVGVFNFVFQKTAYAEINFTVNMTDNGLVNETVFINSVFINLQLKDIDTGLDAPNGNYTVLISDLDSNSSNIQNIINANNISILNTYAIDTNLSISIVNNDTVTNSLLLVNPRQNISLDIYLNFENVTTRTIEVLTSSLSAITFSNVYLYTFVEGDGFILETVKQTNVQGQVSFNIVELTKIYTICNTNEGFEKCISQITFEDPATDQYQIIHDSTLNPIEKNYLQYISYSFSENKTNTSTEMTFTFEDSNAVVDAFCMNVTRYTNDTSNYLGVYCNNNPSGQVVQSFSLTTDQRIEFDFVYLYEDIYTKLNKYVTYYDNVDFTEVKETSIIDVIFLALFFAISGYLLRLSDFDLYNIGVLGFLIVTFIIQSVITENYSNLSIWGFLLIKTLLLYFTRAEA